MDPTMKARYPSTSGPLPSKMQENLAQTAGYLRTLQNRFDSSVWTPGKQRSKDFASVYPVAATFIIIFSSLSFIPVASYLVVVSFVLISLVATGIGIAVGITLFVGFWAGVLLFLVLLTTFIMAVAGTLNLLGGYLLYRLFFHLYSQDGQGFRGWVHEIRDRLVPGTMQAYATDARDDVGTLYNGTGETNGSIKIEVE